MKAVIFWCFDVYPVRSSQKVQAQAKVSAIQSEFQAIFRFLMTMIFFNITENLLETQVQNVFLRSPDFH